MQAESASNAGSVPAFALQADDPGAAMHIRTWAKQVLYQHQRGTCNDFARDRANKALAVAAEMDRWALVHKRSAG